MANVKLQEQLREREKTIHQLLKEQLQERERTIHDLERKVEGAKRMWAKDDILREQNKELPMFLRECDKAEVERGQRLKQIHELQEHVQEKEHLFVELQEKETARRAQALIMHLQEMVNLQTSDNQMLKTKLRERTEQNSQLWLQLVYTTQHLRSELANARERTGSYSDELHSSQAYLREASQFRQSNGSHLDFGGNDKNGGLSNGNNGENNSSSVSNRKASGQAGRTNPFAVHQEGVPQSIPSDLLLGASNLIFSTLAAESTHSSN